MLIESSSFLQLLTIVRVMTLGLLKLLVLNQNCICETFADNIRYLQIFPQVTTGLQPGQQLPGHNLLLLDLTCMYVDVVLQEGMDFLQYAGGGCALNEVHGYDLIYVRFS